VTTRSRHLAVLQTALEPETDAADISMVEALRDARHAHDALLRHPTDKNAASYDRVCQQWLERSSRHDSSHLPPSAERRRM
jgi:hypothetical protein